MIEERKLKILIIGILFTMFLLFIVEDVNGLVIEEQFSSVNPTFGSTNQDASNPQHQDLSKKVLKSQSTITIKNNDGGDLLDVSISFTPNGKYDMDDTDISIVSTPQIIPEGGEGILVLEAEIPRNLDAVDSNGDKLAFDVGKLVVQGEVNGITYSDSFNVFMERSNKLKMQTVEATINENRKRNVKNNVKIENINPGDIIDFLIEMENKYTDKSKLSIQNVNVEISCNDEKDIDFDDHTTKFGTIGTKDEKEETMQMFIEEDAKKKTVKCSLIAIGTDKNGARHGDQRHFSVKIGRKNHNLIIKDVVLEPKEVSCSDNSIKMSLKVLNLGLVNEKNVGLTIDSDSVGFSEGIDGKKLNVDNAFIETFIIPVSPKKVAQGMHLIEVTTHYDKTKTSNTENVFFENTCLLSSKESVSETKENPLVKKEDTKDPQATKDSSKKDPSKENLFDSENSQIGLLIGGIILAAVLIAIMSKKFLKRKK